MQILVDIQIALDYSELCRKKGATVENLPTVMYIVNLKKAYEEAGSPSIYSVAKAAGVSWETASKYINESALEMSDLKNQALLVAWALGVPIDQPEQMSKYFTVKVELPEADDIPGNSPPIRIPA